ncbi:MAG: hypothetical protein ACE5HI_20365, partial [bacterium]
MKNHENKEIDYSAEIQKLAYSLKEDIINIRRKFHKYPELSWQEFKTAEQVVRMLKENGLVVKSGICGMGV